MIQETAFLLAEAAEASNSPKRTQNQRKKWELVNSTSRGTKVSSPMIALLNSSSGTQNDKQQAKNHTNQKWGSELKTADKLACVKAGVRNTDGPR